MLGNWMKDMWFLPPLPRLHLARPSVCGFAWYNVTQAEPYLRAESSSCQACQGIYTHKTNDSSSIVPAACLAAWKA